jgi:hypothetical protein
MRLAELWKQWTDELFLLMFRKGILDSLSIYGKVDFHSNSSHLFVISENNYWMIVKVTAGR